MMMNTGKQSVSTVLSARGDAEEEDEIIVEEEEIVVEEEEIVVEGETDNPRQPHYPATSQTGGGGRSRRRRSSTVSALRGIEKNRCRVIVNSSSSNSQSNHGAHIIPTFRGLSKNQNHVNKRTASLLLKNEIDCDELEEALSRGGSRHGGILESSSHHTSASAHAGNRRLGDSKEKAESLQIGSHNDNVRGTRRTSTIGVNKEMKRQQHATATLPSSSSSTPGALNMKSPHDNKEKDEDKKQPSYLSYLDGNNPLVVPVEYYDEEDVLVLPYPGITTAATGGSPQDHWYSSTEDEEEQEQPVANHSHATQSTDATTSNNNNNNEGLVEALPVTDEDASNNVSQMMLARPVPRDSIILNQQTHMAAMQAKEKRHKILAIGCVVLAFLVLVLSLSFGGRLSDSDNQEGGNDSMSLENKEIQPPQPSSPTTNQDGTSSSTGSENNPDIIPPPMENLELLYEDLPQQTKESLSNNVNSPQYQAWWWLLNHPNVATYPEWRKKQLFAMGTLFYSFEGPNWPGANPAHQRWMDINTSECSWVLSDPEVQYFYHQSTLIIGPDAYHVRDWQPCNSHGRLQMLALIQIFLPDDLQPSFPPEIGFLTSLKLIGLSFGKINVKLEDLLIPELLQLPALEGITFSSNKASGTIPTKLGKLTGLRHLLLNANRLTGTIPSQIARMTSLEHLNLGDEAGVTGTLPSQLFLMTRLTGLEIYRTSVTGTIPTELGWLTRMREISLDGNPLLSGNIPSILGLMTDMEHLFMENSAFSGSIPSELGLMTNMVNFRVGNELDAPGSGNDFSGPVPTELWKLSNVETLKLHNLPNLRGRIPSEVFLPHLTTLSLGGSPHISGVIPGDICFIEELDFDCSDLLCGCDCQCSNYSLGNQTLAVSNQRVP